MANLVFTDQASHIQLLPVDKLSKKPKDNDERFKKGEWSDGAINCLLDAYETKWNNRNRGNLRVGDWEEVCSHVSNRNGGTKSMKTPTQCKNKIEGMKKKYRLEAVESCSNSRANCSSWPFFSRMDLMLRCPARGAGIPGGMDAGYQQGISISPIENGETFDIPDQYPVHLYHHHDRQESEQEEDASNNFLQRNENYVGVVLESDTSAPGSKVVASPSPNPSPSPSPSPRGKQARQNKTKLRKQTKNNSDAVASSIQSFADSILKLEQAKMEMYKDTERLRAEAETRRAELELKRTEIIMNTQLQIARLLSCKSRKRKPLAGTSQAPATNITSRPVDPPVDAATCVSGIEVAGQPTQSVNPGNKFVVSEPSSMQH